MSESSLNDVLNDQHVSEPVETPPADETPVDTGEPPAEPPAAKPQEPDHVPRSALLDERRKRQELEQRLQQWQQQAQPKQPEAKQEQLKPEQFDTWEEYYAALAEEKAAKVFEQRAQQFSQQQREAYERQKTAEDLGDMLKAGREKYADYDAVVSDPNVPITDTMMTAMMANDFGHEVGYHLGKNPAEAARIARLPASSQAKEIRNLAKQFSAPPPAPTPTPLPRTLTTQRSANGQFTSNQAWDGPTPLNDILGQRS